MALGEECVRIGVSSTGVITAPVDHSARPSARLRTMSSHAARNRQVVERYWEAHFLRDWDRMATFFSDDAHYTDVGVDGQGRAWTRSRSSTG